MRVGALALLLALWPGAVPAACRLALVLALDVSASVSAPEYQLQTEGLAAALLSERERNRILDELEAPVRISVFEWSDPGGRALVLPWTEITGGAALEMAAAQIAAAERRVRGLSTGIGSALATGRTLLEGQPECWRRVLDLSGDGPSNAGPTPQAVRATLPAWMVVNALSVGAMAPFGSADAPPSTDILADYFRRAVIRGPGAFVETATGYEDYAAAMERKLIRELAALTLGAVEDRPDRPQ